MATKWPDHARLEVAFYLVNDEGQALKCLNPLVSPDGQIMSPTEVERMTVDLIATLNESAGRETYRRATADEILKFEDQRRGRSSP